MMLHIHEPTSLRRRLLVGAALATSYLALPRTPTASADTAPVVTPADALPQTWPGPINQELRQIQQSLGGSAVEQFPSLSDRNPDPQRTPPTASTSPLNPAHQRHVVETLRMAASQLDEIANRLERLDLYSQADALREQAQRLRLDARGMSGARNQTPTPANPWEQIGPRASSATEPQPLLPDRRQNQIVPQLQPTPAPE